jgi:hypothetical protein
MILDLVSRVHLLGESDNIHFWVEADRSQGAGNIAGLFPDSEDHTRNWRAETVQQCRTDRTGRTPR